MASSSSQLPIDPSDHPSKRLKTDDEKPQTELDHNLALAKRNRELSLNRILIRKTIKDPGSVNLEGMFAEGSWNEALPCELKKRFSVHLIKLIEGEFEHLESVICPPQHLIFNAFNTTPFHSVKVVILGQEPYCGDGEDMGLAFSVNQGIKVPTVLRNIFKELKNDIGCSIPSHGNLEKWALQGVFLLNRVLTVRKYIPKSHAKLGWQEFTDTVIQTISDKKEGVVFVLWGKTAQEKISLINTTRHHLILKAPDPAGVNAKRGFFGCKHFSQINKHLEERGIAPIDWQL